ncbi:HelD family protein [Phytomonospora endophytica]|uniref:DNA helicase IV n=1 Tax=Phytomonospora endophytica TaxID=714109 RepID=A0A841G1G5_9ACTN|nr:AAA family ATPase [Phytomonospora endophytica]MBB6039497.1 DNA helicase IV [Phytomonospora endophytica]GIG70224.1 DNA helicase [Phytomonospora endophytica]
MPHAMSTDAAHDTALTTELAAEREHLLASHAALARMRDRTTGLGDVGGNAFSSEALGKARVLRLKELVDLPDIPLFFGRLDFPSEQFHVGRRHVVDDTGEPLVLDWRAPVSRLFYQASVREPMEVELRRRFGFDGGHLTSFEDERLDAGGEETSSALLAAEIERPRVGPMRDIVATIQPEQDDLVRAGLADSICVQGAPGTGKTAVGLHRAAFLLYTHRDRLKRNGVLVVGPNTAFMSYIDQVLPTLGEVDVTQVTVDDLMAPLVLKGTEAEHVEILKHDVRMAELLHRAVWSHISRPDGTVTVTDGGWRHRIPEEDVLRFIDDTRREGLPYHLGRERVRALTVGAVQRSIERRTGESPTEGWLRKLGRSKTVTVLLDAVWPALDPRKLLTRLYTDAGWRAELNRDLFTDEELGLLASKTKAPKFTRADAVLADEIAGLLDRPVGFGHVVVDEAQDLSAMQCRAVARRSPHGSITVLGDLAQGTSPWAARDWSVSMEHMGKPDGRVVALTTGFRVPESIIALANRLLPALDVDVPEALSLRRDGLLDLRETTELGGELASAIADALTFEGSVGVIATEETLDAVRASLPEDHERVTLMPASLAKGLEFDHVIVAEPARIVAAEARGLHRLYVVLTRAVSRLTIVHTEPLPEMLTADPAA